MIRRILLILALSFLVIVFGGCAVGYHGHGHYDHGAHYWDGDGTVYVRGHVHGSGCGHMYLGGRWVYSHVHTADCCCGY